MGFLYVGRLKGVRQQFPSPRHGNDSKLNGLGLLAAHPRDHDHHHHRRVMVLPLEKAQAVAISLSSSHRGQVSLEKQAGRWVTVAHSRDLVLEMDL